MINYKKIFDRILLESKEIKQEDLKRINLYGIENPISKLIIIYYFFKLDINEDEKEELERETWNLSREIRSFIDDLIKKGDLSKAKEITKLKSRTLNCFVSLGNVPFEKEEEKKEIKKEVKITVEKRKRGKKKLYFLVVLIILSLFAILSNIYREKEIVKSERPKEIDFFDYDLSAILEGTKPITAFKSNEILYIVIKKEDEMNKDFLKEEVEKKLKGFAKEVIIQNEDGKKILSFNMP